MSKISGYANSVSALGTDDLLDVSEKISSSPDVYESRKMTGAILAAFIQTYVTPAAVGNTTAQWNADSIEGNITNLGTLGAGQDGQVLTWDNGTSRLIMAPGASYGIVATYDSSGVPTFHASLSAAITAASAGDTVQIYSDINETSAVTVTCKNGVNINFNGFTYTLNNAGTNDAFSVPTGVSMEMFNGKVVRSGGTSSTSNSLALNLAGTGTFKAYNMVFENDFGYACKAAKTLYGGRYYGLVYGLYVSSAKVYNTYSEGDSIGIYLINNGIAYNSEGYSSSGYGIYNNNSQAYFCLGRSNGSVGFYSSNGQVHDCKGYSTADVGISLNNSVYFSNIYGFSGASYGVSLKGNGSGVFGYSTASYGVYFSSGSGNWLFGNVKALSTAASGLYVLNNAGKVEFTSLDVCSTWDNASGHGIIVTGTDNDIIFNGGSVRVKNASANCLYNGSAKSCYFNSLSFLNSTTAVNANITNLQTNTPDAYGNILVG